MLHAFRPAVPELLPHPCRKISTTLRIGAPGLARVYPLRAPRGASSAPRRGVGSVAPAGTPRIAGTRPALWEMNVDQSRCRRSNSLKSIRYGGGASAYLVGRLGNKT